MDPIKAAKKDKEYLYYKALESLYKFALIGVVTESDKVEQDLNLVKAANNVIKDVLDEFLENENKTQ